MSHAHTKTKPIRKEKTVPQIDALAVNQSESVGEVLTSVTREQSKSAKAEMERLLELFRRPANQD